MKLRYLVGGYAFALALSTSGCATHPDKPVATTNADVKPTRWVSPVYPAIAQSDNAEGDVRLCFAVGVNGRVRDSRIVKLKLHTLGGQSKPSR